MKLSTTMLKLIMNWPEVTGYVVFAQTSMECADSSAAVSILHRAVSMDITGQVPVGFVGKDHPCVPYGKQMSLRVVKQYKISPYLPSLQLESLPPATGIGNISAILS
jgi:hypothetical protein